MGRLDDNAPRSTPIHRELPDKDSTQPFAMRIWLNRQALAARQLTVQDIEQALRAENIELPAGSIESQDRQMTVRVERNFLTPQQFRQLALAQGDDGYLVRLGDVARVELGSEENRTIFRGNTVPMVGIGIVKQSTANTLAVAELAKAEVERINSTLPQGMEIRRSYDSSVFVEGAIQEVYKTLLIAGVLVVVIFLFLGNLRATLIPAITIPRCAGGGFAGAVAADRHDGNHYRRRLASPDPVVRSRRRNALCHRCRDFLRRTGCDALYVVRRTRRL